jgi:TolB protein
VLYVAGKQVRVIDSDGWGDRALTSGSTSLSPAWHPSGKIFAYSRLTSRGWRIEVQDLTSGAPRALGTTPEGLNITPTFSSDGAWLAYAHGDEDGVDLYVTPFADGNAAGAARRVTVGHGTDNVSPSFSPEGRRLAFTSGRVGHPEVYLADVDGTNVESLAPDVSAESGYRSNPDWSPDGRQVAFQQQFGGIFQLMVITLRDRAVRQLTSEGRNEDASWAPDGRHLVFSTTRTGVRELFVLDVESGRARQLTHGAGARMPAWSPSLLSTP